MFHNGQDHNTRRTLTLSHSAMFTFTPAKSLKAPYQSICSPEKDKSLFDPSRFYRLYRVYQKKVDNFETALNLAKRLQV